MLQQMRRFATSWFASIIIGIIAFSFVIWGIADIFRGNVDISIATVGGEKVSPGAYQVQYQNVLRGEQNHLSQTITTEQAKRMGLPKVALESLLSDIALANVVKSLGLVTTDAQVAAYVHAIPRFNGPLGTFDHATFVQVLVQNNMTEQQFIDDIRNETTRDQVGAATRNGVMLPDGYARALLAYISEQRAVQYVVLPASAVAVPPAPDDATLTAYVAKHADRYSTPEYRELTFATIGPDDLATRMKVTDAQLRQEYELRKDDPQNGYVVPEKRDIQTISFKNEAAAMAARAKIDSGMSFADAAKAGGTAATPFPAVEQADLGDRGKAVFALPLNGISQPLKNLAGWELTQVTKITPGVNKTFDDVKAVLQKDTLQRMAAAKAQDMANAYTDANSGGASLAEAAQKVGMKVVHIPAVDQNGLVPDGTHAAIPADPEFLQQVFKSDIGVEGDPFTTKDGRVFVMAVKGQTPPHLKPLDQVRAAATAAWQKEQQRKLLTDKAIAFTKEANAAGNLSGVAKQIGATVQNSPALSRGVAPPAGFGIPMLLNIFSAPPGSVVYGPDAAGDGYMLAKITGIVHPPVSVLDPNLGRLQSMMSTRAGTDMADTFALAARAQQGVTLNQQNIARAMGDGS